MALTNTYHQPALHPELEPPELTEEEQLAIRRLSAVADIEAKIDYIHAEQIALASLQHMDAGLRDKAAHEAVGRAYKQHMAAIAHIRERIHEISLEVDGFTFLQSEEIDGEKHEVLRRVSHCNYDVQSGTLVGQMAVTREIAHFTTDQIIV